MDLNRFLNEGIKDIARIAKRFYLRNHKGRMFMIRMASSLRKSARIRTAYEKKGVHIPPVLIASIASSCNLSCAGCYARAGKISPQGRTPGQMEVSDWEGIFAEASGIGMSFVLLAGGEPLLRREMIQAATGHKNMFFPVFTNGTMVDEEYMALFDKHRHMVPVLSIEGSDAQTDARRGCGIAARVWETAEAFKERGILYGASITVTRENKEEVTGQAFVDRLRERGCGVLLYVEYIPVTEGTEHLVLMEADAAALQEGVERLRMHRANDRMIIISFPGDEEQLGGCLAAGRGFFHVNPDGGAEPCPFSPFSAMNLKDQSILDVLQSPFFEEVRELSAGEVLNHQGGCTLFQQEEEVRARLKERRMTK